MENGSSYLPGRLSAGDGFESHSWPVDWFLALRDQERNLQCLRRRPFDLGRDAVHYECASFVAFKGGLVNLLASDWPLQNEKHIDKGFDEGGTRKGFQIFVGYLVDSSFVGSKNLT